MKKAKITVKDVFSYFVASCVIGGLVSLFFSFGVSATVTLIIFVLAIFGFFTEKKTLKQQTHDNSVSEKREIGRNIYGLDERGHYVVYTFDRLVKISCKLAGYGLADEYDLKHIAFDLNGNVHVSAFDLARNEMIYFPLSDVLSFIKFNNRTFSTFDQLLDVVLTKKQIKFINKEREILVENIILQNKAN